MFIQIHSNIECADFSSDGDGEEYKLLSRLDGYI